VTVNIDTELTTSFNPETGTCSYKLERGDAIWIVEIPLADFEQHGTNVTNRRALLESKLEEAMRTNPNGQKDRITSVGGTA
jgi:hypothetical protein